MIVRATIPNNTYGIKHNLVFLFSVVFLSFHIYIRFVLFLNLIGFL